MMRAKALRGVVLMTLLAVLAGGCEATVSKAKFDRLNEQWLDALQENSDLTRRNARLHETIRRQNEQIAALQALGDKRLDKLFHVRSIELTRHSGGVDTDGEVGDDVIKVYLQPIDQFGHAIKAAGEATVQLYDLAEPEQRNLIAEYRWSVDELGKQWAGGFVGGSQFTLTCPWPDEPPAHDQITIRAVFTDYLTGRSFTAQKVVKISLPAVDDQATPAPAQ